MENGEAMEEVINLIKKNMQAPKQTREQRIRVLENVVMIFNDRIKKLESIIYDVQEDDKQKE
mgnify:CR=1 FL=1